MKPHKHAALIHAYADGAKIQVKSLDNNEWVDTPQPIFSTSTEYRIKPDTIKYRNFLWCPLSSLNPNPKLVVCVVNEKDQKGEPRDTWTGFIKWLGDWQEAEV